MPMPQKSKIIQLGYNSSSGRYKRELELQKAREYLDSVTRDSNAYITFMCLQKLGYDFKTWSEYIVFCAEEIVNAPPPNTDEYLKIFVKHNGEMVWLFSVVVEPGDIVQVVNRELLQDIPTQVIKMPEGDLAAIAKVI